MGLFRSGGKRVVDVLVAGGVLIGLAPLLAGLGAVLAVTQGWPVLFRQERAGWRGRPFRLLKFRTMTDARGPDGVPLPDGQRLTAVGRWLRRTSLDELPEVWNVLRGDMSLVGPRPLLLDYLPLYAPEQARRHEVRPGITGWAQVHGRNATAWPERFQLDVWYVDHVSFRVDCTILARTLGAVLHGAGVSAEGHATMPRFRGEQ